MKASTIILFMTLFIVSCDTSTQDNNTETTDKILNDTTVTPQTQTTIFDDYIDGIPNTVRQNIFGRTEIVLSGLGDPYDLHLYGKIEFFIDNKKVLEYKEKYLEVEGYQDNVCTFFGKRENGKYVLFYVFHYSDRPSPAKFLIFKQIDKKIKFIGTTENSTADIFGDVDLDGKFEIGGFNNHCEPGIEESDIPGHPLFCIDHLRVYEIGNTFDRDTLLENFIIRNKKRALTKAISNGG